MSTRPRFQQYLVLASKYVLVSVGKVIGRFLPVHQLPQLVFFFPYYHTGGAERVHTEIVRCVADQQPWLIFTRKSNGTALLATFQEFGQVIQIAAWLDRNPGLDFRVLRRVVETMWIGVWAFRLTRAPGTTVFGCNSAFFYELVPHLHPNVRCMDLLHAYEGALLDLAIPLTDRMNHRIVISRHIRDKLMERYYALNFSNDFVKRIVVIPNRTDVPKSMPQKHRGSNLQALYVGRGTSEKRVHCVGEIARTCALLGLPVEFTVVGDVKGALEPDAHPFLNLMGEITDTEKLPDIHAQADVLLLVSSREGFPLVIMEAMAHGTVPISTEVGGIPLHVRNGETGFLVPSSPDRPEHEIVEDFVRLLALLAADRTRLQRMSHNAYQYAREHFGGERFCSDYRQVLMLGQHTGSS